MPLELEDLFGEPTRRRDRRLDVAVLLRVLAGLIDDAPDSDEEEPVEIPDVRESLGEPSVRVRNDFFPWVS